MAFSFVEHLQQACSKPIRETAFLDGYRAVLAGVARRQAFELHGLVVEAPPRVYSPHETSSTRFFMNHFPSLGLNEPRGRLLEIGCGAGAISLLAARRGWDVLATDIDPAAVQATKENAARNGLTLDARQSDLFGSLSSEQFDVIVFNQPFLHAGREIAENERTLSDPDGNLHVRFLRDSARHLCSGGYVAFAYSNCSNPALLQQPGWDLELRAFDFEAGSDYIRALFKATPTR